MRNSCYRSTRKDTPESTQFAGKALPRRPRRHTQEIPTNEVLRDTSCPLWFKVLSSGIALIGYGIA
jgi:hypothetical protein